MTKKFQDYLCSRLFVRNDYGSVETLLAAISAAAAIPEDQEWRLRKAAFNEIGEKAPMRETVYLKYTEVPEYLDREVKAFTEYQFFAGDLPQARTRNQYPSTYLDIVLITADNKAGISTFHIADGVAVHSEADWAGDYPDMETVHAAFYLYTGDHRLLDTAAVDGDAWRDIEENGLEEFYTTVMTEGLSLRDAIDKRSTLQP